MVTIKEAMNELFTVEEMKEIKGVGFACKFQGGKITSIDLAKLSTIRHPNTRNFPTTISMKGGENNESSKSINLRTIG